MMFSKLSIFVAATLAAFATAAFPQPQGGNVASNPQTNDVKTLKCPSSGPVPKCCTNMHSATADEAKLANNKLGSGIGAGDDIWAGCIDFVQGTTCPGPTVCCDKIASDGSYALKCVAAIEA